jgi:hypothetical protein
MKTKITALLLAVSLLAAFAFKKSNDKPAIKMVGTWQLISHTEITKGNSVVTDYKNTPFIKIINDTHFAFLTHQINTPKDSSNHFDAGGGLYTLQGNKYTEHLDYYIDKNWEGKTFDFTVTMKNDTLIQQGLEKVEKENIDRIIIEKYLRLR